MQKVRASKLIARHYAAMQERKQTPTARLNVSLRYELASTKSCDSHHSTCPVNADYRKSVLKNEKVGSFGLDYSPKNAAAFIDPWCQLTSTRLHVDVTTTRPQRLLLPK